MKPFKNILMLPHPFPTIWIGHMKLCLYHTFLSLLLLSGCGGSSGGGGEGATSSSKKAKAAKACTTPLPNGKGELPWNTKTKKYSTTCKVVSCNAGYVKNTGENTCDIPDTGKYADRSGDEKSCNAITRDRGGFNTFSANMIAVNSADGCGFTCNTGFLKSGRACNFPRKGKYVAGSGSEENCDNVGGTPGGFNEFLDNIKGVNSASGCDFSCKSGYVKSASGYTCTQGYHCVIDNGAGVKTTSSSTTCQVVDCDAGYDSTQVPITECQPTVSGFFSLANDKTRTTCLTPANSSPTSTTRLSSADGCYTCDGGYLKNTASSTCDFPSKGKYVNGGTESSCNPIATLQGGATATWIRGAAATADACPFSCSPGFVKSGRACNTPDTGKYADGGIEKSCDTPTGATGGFKEFLPNTGAVSTVAGCGFSCNAGFVKNTSDRTCNIPDPGKYADNAGGEQSCDTLTGVAGGFKEFLANMGAVDSATDCGFSCNVGFVKNTVNRTCNIPDPGKYADNAGGEQSCSTPTGGFNTFLPNTAAVSTAAGCDFTCNAGFVKKTVGRTCATPDTGKYADNGVEKSCSPITEDSGGFDAFAVNTGAVTAADGCGFSCNAGFVKDSSGRECNFPSPGNYVTAGGTESSCTDITGITGFGSWLEGAATADDACPFSCASGYTVSGRICRKPEMLALGGNTSRILFSTGEVEVWGRVNEDHIWRAHLKENLGSHTPQALVSGYFHQCIILENSGQNHGRLMCWGNNGSGELGVGDTINKTTPTAVTATILGDAGGGVPNTVKSVALGDYHTCAILHDDTVVCWGDNTYAQIGGGSSGFGKTTSGTVGGPLGSTTARRIAVGNIHTCAVLSDSSVECWGRNIKGQTGGGTPNLGAGRTATEIAMSNEFSCAILDDDSVKCWGANGATNYIGTGGVPNLGVNRTATGIALGYEHACVLLNNKTVKCWGKNDYGQVGGGSAGSDQVLRGTSGDPLGGQTAIEIAAGYKHTCAVMESDHSVKCWGVNNSTAVLVNSYGQIIGEVAMTGGTNGTGTSTGESQVLTANSTPTATSLDSDASGKICKIELSGETLGSPWVAKNYTAYSLTYNAGGSTTISDVIDSLIAAIGSPVNIAGTDVTLSKSGTDKIAATTDTAVFEGMTLTIFHDDDGEDCTTSPVATEISLSGASGGDEAEGLWVISEDYTGTGDKTVNLDSVHTGLGNTGLSKEEIADKIVADVAGASWAGKQNVDLPYTATKVQNSDNSDCPSGDFCVLFERVFKGTEGNYGIPFGDRDYSY